MRSEMKIHFNERFRRRTSHRRGKILVFLAIALPSMFGMLGLLIDGAILLTEDNYCQHVADSGATVAARVLQEGGSLAEAQTAVQDIVAIQPGYDIATVTVNAPPNTGDYAGREGFVEVEVTQSVNTHLVHMVGSGQSENAVARAVAGYENSTDQAVIVSLAKNPGELSILGVGTLPAFPVLVAGMEVLGVGDLNVDGAILVNCEWGGVDENGNPAGVSNGLPWGLATPLTTELTARDVRVVGGVLDPDDISAFEEGEASPLKANRLAVPDPLADLPVPTIAEDAANVVDIEHGGVTIVGLPLGPETVLSPGVYEWIEVISGRVRFEPGVYIVRGVSPVTQLAINFTAGVVTAEGVMFYVTDNAAYSATTGGVDSTDTGEPPNDALVTLPSVLINMSLLGSNFSALDDPNSVYDGMFLFQRRYDRRAIALMQAELLFPGTIDGQVYAKGGHAILSLWGDSKVAVAAATIRVIVAGELTLRPSSKFDAAQDVFLVE